MAGPNGTKQKPFYTLEDGTVLELREIKSLVLDRWRIEYGKTHPEPLPPVIQLSNGDDWYDANDPWYKHRMAAHEEQLNTALAIFLFSKGVKTDPPETWEPVFDDDIETVNVRYRWLSEILSTSDITGLMNAVMGVDNPTPDGIEEAEKKSTPDGADNR